MNQSRSAVILLSGGIDSTTVLALAQEEGFTTHGLTIRYGQRHAAELEAAKYFAAEHADDHTIIDVDLRAIGGSSLTSSLPVPKLRNVAQPSTEIPNTYVPARNTIFLSLALGLAEVVGSHDIFLGVNALDYSGYPDCRPEYIDAFQRMADLATRSGVEGGRITIHTPLIHMSKADIIRRGHELGVDFSRTISCYDSNGRGDACGSCDSCQLRRRGFADAGINDPTRYRS